MCNGRKIDVNVASSLLAALFMIMVARAYWHLITVDRGSWAYYMVRGTVCVAITAVARSGYWDIFQFAAGDHWLALRTALGGQAFSTVFNLPMILAGYYFLKGRWVLIPEDERHLWHWWNAWLHPRGMCMRVRTGPPK